MSTHVNNPNKCSNSSGYTWCDPVFGGDLPIRNSSEVNAYLFIKQPLVGAAVGVLEGLSGRVHRSLCR